MLRTKSIQSTCYSHHNMPHCWKGQTKVHPYSLNIKLRLDIAGTLQKEYKYLFSHFSIQKDLSSISREKDLWTASLTGLVPSICAHFFVKSKSNIQPHQILQSAFSMRVLYTSRSCISIQSSQTESLRLFACLYSQPALPGLIRDETFTLKTLKSFLDWDASLHSPNQRDRFALQSPFCISRNLYFISSSAYL